MTTQAPYRRFSLSPQFLEEFKGKQPKWGPVGYITYKSRYARLKDDGLTEEFWETLKRVVEGVFNIQKKHCANLGLEWNNAKSQKTAQEMFRAMWEFRFLPSGRGLWMAGVPFVEERTGSGMYNCAFISTEEIDRTGARAFAFIMDGLMLGVGMGFDTKGAGKITIQEPHESDSIFVVNDSREGWVESVELLLNAFFRGGTLPKFDYSAIRAAGLPLKGFGGVSSGYGPLKELHEDLSNLLSQRVGLAITSTDIVDIENYISKCVIAGNIRRSAAIALGDPNDGNFMVLKHDQEKLRSHRYGSNNSIIATRGMDYGKVVEHTIRQGEPGFIWLDNARNYGRFKDGKRTDDLNVKGFNPSLRHDTRIMTNTGINEIQDLCGTSFTVCDLDGNESDATCWKSGENKSLYKIQFSDGNEVYCTPEHSWPVLVKNSTCFDYISIDTPELRPGMYIADIRNDTVLFDNEKYNGVALTKELGEIVGWLLGDGWVRDDESRKYIGMCFGYKDYTNAERITDNFNSIFGSNVKLQCRESTKEFSTSNTHVIDVLNSLGYDVTKQSLPKCIWKSNDRFIKGFISGLFGADGYVERARIGTGNVVNRVCLTSSRKGLVLELKELLSFYGIASRIVYKNLCNPVFPNGKKYNRTYDIYRLSIQGEQEVGHFANTFTISNEYKQRELEGKKSALNKYTTRTIKTIIANACCADVYDVEVYNDTHAFKIACGITGNCSEQQLESMEMCCLCESFPNNHTSLEDYLHTLKLAYLYAKSVTLVNTHWPETNAIMLKNRRIGLSQSGIQQARARLGTRTLLEWCDKGYEYIQQLDAKYSDWLCIPRSKRTTSVKPSGTVSLLPGVTPGIHYAEAEYYIRRIRFEKTSKFLPALVEAGYKIEDDVYNKTSVVVEFPIHEKDFSKGKKEVSIWEQLEFAAKYQYYWSDNAVSITVTFKPEEAKDIKSALELYEDRLKVVSFLPLSEHGYAQAPYEPITKEQYEEMVKNIKPLVITEATDASGEKFCDGDSCVV